MSTGAVLLLVARSRPAAAGTIPACRRGFALAILAIALVTLAIAVPDPVRAETDLARLSGHVRRALFEAEEMRAAQEFKQAATILQRCLREYPEQDHVLIRFHLGNNLALAGEAETALLEYQNATRLDPQYVPAWLNLAEVAYDLKRYLIAGEAFLQGFAEATPQRPELLYHAAVAFLTGDEPSHALPLLEELVSGTHGRPMIEWFRALFSAALELDRAPEFAGAAGEMVELYANDPEAWRLASRFAAGAGAYDRAAVTLTIASYLEPLSRGEQLELASLYQAIGIPSIAGEHFAAALADSGSAAEYEQLVSLHLSAHDDQRAWQTLERALAREPTARLWSLAGDLHYGEQRFAKAYAAFAGAADLGATGGRIQLMLGYCAFELERWQPAAEHLGRAAGFPDQSAAARALLRRIP